MLSLAEELFLLALDDDEGKVAFSGPRYASAGAILLDLARAGRVAQSGKNLEVTNGAFTGDSLLDRALSLMMESSKPRNAKHWVRKIAGAFKDMDEQVSERLMQRGMIRREQHQILWVFPAKRYPRIDGEAQDSIIDRVRAVLLVGAEPDPRTRGLIGLGKSASLLKYALSKDERKATRKRVDALIAAEPFVATIARAVKDAANDDTAAMAAVTASISVAASS